MDIEADLTKLKELLEHTCQQKRRAKFMLYFDLCMAIVMLAIAIRQNSLFVLICAIVNLGISILMIDTIKLYKMLESEIRIGITDIKQLIVRPT